MLISIVSAVAVIGVLIFVHELGHFLMAKRLGIRVVRFSIGFPPKIWGIRRGETEYAIGAIPLGGFNRMLGDEVGEEPGAEELNTYLREIGLDLIGAAAKTSKLQAASASKPADQGGAGDSEVSAAAQAAPTDRIGDDNAAIVDLVRKIRGAEPEGRAGAQATEILGRELRPEENLLVGAIAQTGSWERARELLSENPPAELIASFRSCAFPTQRLAKRVAVVLAGPIANVLFAPILLALVFMYGVPTLLPVIGKVQAKMPAAAAGLTPGDRIISVDGQPVETWSDFSHAIKSRKGAPVHIEAIRGTGTTAHHLDLVIQPQLHSEKTALGTKAEEWIIGVLPSGAETVTRFNPFTAAYKGVSVSISMSRDLVLSIASIISGATPVRQALGGPIMIAQMAGREAHAGLADLAMFTVMLSLELGLFNVLPIPFLDGGHLLFFACEGVLGRPLDLRTREIALQVGLFIIVAVMAFVIFNDISRIVQG